MKINELIKELISLEEQYGNINVKVRVEDKYIVGIYGFIYFSAHHNFEMIEIICKNCDENIRNQKILINNGINSTIKKRFLHRRLRGKNETL